MLEFESRYRDETPTVDARVITLTSDSETNAGALLEEWRGGAATQESFAELADAQGASVEGGLYEGLTESGMDESLAVWLFDSARVSGDATSVTGDEGENSYVVYYVGTNAPEWSQSIKSTLLTTALSEYLEEISEGYEITDPKGNLNYLKVQAEESAAAESTSLEAAAEDAAEESAQE